MNTSNNNMIIFKTENQRNLPPLMYINHLVSSPIFTSWKIESIITSSFLLLKSKDETDENDSVPVQADDPTPTSEIPTTISTEFGIFIVISVWFYSSQIEIL